MFQVQEFEEEFEKITGGKPTQTRFMRSQQDLKVKMEEQAASAAGGDGDDEGTQIWCHATYFSWDVSFPWFCRFLQHLNFGFGKTTLILYTHIYTHIISRFDLLKNFFLLIWRYEEVHHTCKADDVICKGSNHERSTQIWHAQSLQQYVSSRHGREELFFTCLTVGMFWRYLCILKEPHSCYMESDFCH